MIENKNIVYILIFIIAGITIYTVWSNNDSLKQIKKLTQKIENNVDSLGIVSNRYDSLKTAYENIHSKLNATKGKLKVFKSDVDSIMALRITDISSLNKALKSTLENNQLDKTDREDISTTDFRFN